MAPHPAAVPPSVPPPAPSPAPSPPQAPAVTTADELTTRWRALLGPRERGPVLRACLWLLLLDGAGRQLPVLVPVDDVPEEPDAALADGLLGLAASVLDEQAGGTGSAALALARPGRWLVTAADAAWRSALQGAADRRGVALAAVHLVAAGQVLPLRAPRSAAGDGDAAATG